MRARVPDHHPRTTFHTVSSETVWKSGSRPESGLRGPSRGDEGGSIDHYLPLKTTVEKPSAIFQTVSLGTSVNKVST
jgi:hypothetical protein